MNPLAAIPAYFDMARTRPGKRPARKAWDTGKFNDAFDAQVKSKGADPDGFEIQPPFFSEPKTIHEGAREMVMGEGKYGSNSVPEDNPLDNRIRINPNADEVFLAHELGHIAAKQAGLGKLVRNLRDNPQLSSALGAAVMALPAGAAALIPGDDDIIISLAASLAASSPKLLDEAFANQNALAMMNRAGSRASLGQRGKLAGAYLSYLGTPIVAGLGGNIGGNFMDDELTSALGYGQ